MKSKQKRQNVYNKYVLHRQSILKPIIKQTDTQQADKQINFPKYFLYPGIYHNEKILTELFHLGATLTNPIWKI